MQGTNNQRELFLSIVNNRETIAAIEANNDAYFLQKRTEKFPLNSLLPDVAFQPKIITSDYK